MPHHHTTDPHTLIHAPLSPPPKSYPKKPKALPHTVLLLLPPISSSLQLRLLLGRVRHGQRAFQEHGLGLGQPLLGERLEVEEVRPGQLLVRGGKGVGLGGVVGVGASRPCGVVVGSCWDWICVVISVLCVGVYVSQWNPEASLPNLKTILSVVHSYLGDVTVQDDLERQGAVNDAGP